MTVPASTRTRNLLAGFLAISVGAVLVALSPSLVRAWAGHRQSSAPAQRITLDGQGQGRVFDGVGAISGGSSRLLYDYPEEQRRQILDYLFRPDYGASLQILKVEIGSDTNSTITAEPSHMRTPDDLNCHRGLEWWLMRQARARNPQMKFYGLMWSAPGWFKGGVWSQDMVRYIMAWIGCAEQNGVPVSYIGGLDEWFGPAQDEAPFYINLKRALRTAFPNVQVVATDEHYPPQYWVAAETMGTDAAYRNAVDILGEHDVCVWKSRYTHCHATQAALHSGKPLWVSEQGAQSATAGAGPLARALNRGYIDARLTANIQAPLIASYYGDTEIGGNGLALAEWPWSGYYQVTASTWVDAQTTQFVRPGWRYIDSASGYLRGGGSYVTLRSPSTGDYSVIVETMDSASATTVTLAPTGGLSTGKAQLWSTNVRSASPSDWFVHRGALTPANGKVSFVAEPGHVYTISTTTGQHRGGAAPPRGTGTSMTLPMPYDQDFEHAEPTLMAPYFEDLEGAFEARPCAAGRAGTCYQQVLTQQPIPWHTAAQPVAWQSGQLRPTSIVGDPMWWGDYEVSVDAMLEQASSVELLGRVDKYDQYLVSGYHFRIASSGAWKFYTVDASGNSATLAAGHASFGIGVWHQLTLTFKDGRATVKLDGQPLATVTATAHTTGQVGVSVGAWTTAQFDNLSVRPTDAWPQFVASRTVKATATSEQNLVYNQASYPASGAVDGRVESCWWSRQEPGPAASLPQAITLHLSQARTVYGLAYRPPINEQGNITAYAVYLSNDGRRFSKVAAGNWPEESATQIASWHPQQARFVRLQALRSKNYGAAACEVQVALSPLNLADGKR